MLEVQRQGSARFDAALDEQPGDEPAQEFG